MNADKFSKSIDDDQLDEVAGGFKGETQKDIKFLNAIGKDLGIKLDKNAGKWHVIDAWEKIGIAVATHTDDENDYYKDRVILTRQDAMIEAMRKTKKFVDLDKYL